MSNPHVECGDPRGWEAAAHVAVRPSVLDTVKPNNNNNDDELTRITFWYSACVRSSTLDHVQCTIIVIISLHNRVV